MTKHKIPLLQALLMQRQNKQSLKKTTSLQFNTLIFAIIGAALAVGIIIGISFSSVAISDPENVASRSFIDSAAPDPELCVQYGASAIVTETRTFVTLNPFRVYTTQPRMQPGCVLRSADWAILQQRKLLTPEQVNDCKNRMNTFAFTGKLEDSPQIACVYQNDAAGNSFLTQANTGAIPAQ